MARTFTYAPGPVSRVIRHPDHGGYVALKPGTEFPGDHVLVKAYPALFTAVDEIGSDVETATRAPGQKRHTRRAR